MENSCEVYRSMKELSQQSLGQVEAILLILHIKTDNVNRNNGVVKTVKIKETGCI